SLAASNGDRVEEGQLVAVLEAMKMEKPLLATRSGVVTGLGVRQGDTVGAGALICHIEAAGQEDQ
ncbi:MAG: acetyl-CoA carboxylase biotin carboxyl carrier protein subunit, partial [Schaalia georgiae]|nr:acetyl-CoA carboxylase biotin carboxyl carrier protein subunit [Schaalia georgiae]